MILSGHAPIQVPHLLHRVGLGFGVPFSSSSSAPKGHSSVHRLHWVHLWKKNSGKDMSPDLGCTAMPRFVDSRHWMAFRAAPVASSIHSPLVIVCLTLPARS